MNRKLAVSLMCSAGLLCAATAHAEGADPCAIDTKVRADGTVELSNIGHTTKCEVAPAPHATTPAAPPAPAAAPASASPVAVDTGKESVAAAAADAATTPPADQKDPRENYREAMLAGAPGTTAANPAVSRRYKMMDKATYQATVLGGSPPGQDAGGAGSQ